MVELKDLEESFSRILDEKLKSQKQEDDPMAESRYCKDCRPYAEVDELKHQGALEKKLEEVEKLTAERDKAQERLEAVAKAHLPPTPNLFDDWESCPDCKPRLVPILKDRYIQPAFDEGKKSIGKDEVERWLKENRYLPAIREIVVQKGKK